MKNNNWREEYARYGVNVGAKVKAFEELIKDLRDESKMVHVRKDLKLRLADILSKRSGHVDQNIAEKIAKLEKMNQQDADAAITKIINQITQHDTERPSSKAIEQIPQDVGHESAVLDTEKEITAIAPQQAESEDTTSKEGIAFYFQRPTNPNVIVTDDDGNTEEVEVFLEGYFGSSPPDSEEEDEDISPADLRRERNIPEEVYSTTAPVMVENISNQRAELPFYQRPAFLWLAASTPLAPVVEGYSMYKDKIENSSNPNLLNIYTLCSSTLWYSAASYWVGASLAYTTTGAMPTLTLLGALGLGIIICNSLLATMCIAATISSILAGENRQFTNAALVCCSTMLFTAGTATTKSMIDLEYEQVAVSLALSAVATISAYYLEFSSKQGLERSMERS